MLYPTSYLKSMGLGERQATVAQGFAGVAGLCLVCLVCRQGRGKGAAGGVTLGAPTRGRFGNWLYNNGLRRGVNLVERFGLASRISKALDLSAEKPLAKQGNDVSMTAW